MNTFFYLGKYLVAVVKMKRPQNFEKKCLVFATQLITIMLYMLNVQFYTYTT